MGRVDRCVVWQRPCVKCNVQGESSECCFNWVCRQCANGLGVL